MLYPFMPPHSINLSAPIGTNCYLSAKWRSWFIRKVHEGKSNSSKIWVVLCKEEKFPDIQHSSYMIVIIRFPRCLQVIRTFQLLQHLTSNFIKTGACFLWTILYTIKFFNRTFSSFVRIWRMIEQEDLHNLPTEDNNCFRTIMVVHSSTCFQVQSY